MILLDSYMFVQFTNGNELNLADSFSASCILSSNDVGQFGMNYVAYK